jgi:hypothetical protein
MDVSQSCPASVAYTSRVDLQRGLRPFVQTEEAASHIDYQQSWSLWETTGLAESAVLYDPAIIFAKTSRQAINYGKSSHDQPAF